MLHASKSFRPISIQCKISRDQLFAITFFSNPLSQRDPLRLIACISKESDRKMSIERHAHGAHALINFVTTGVRLKILIQ
jgi:hypothetical protein